MRLLNYTFFTPLNITESIQRTDYYYHILIINLIIISYSIRGEISLRIRNDKPKPHCHPDSDVFIGRGISRIALPQNKISLLPKYGRIEMTVSFCFIGRGISKSIRAKETIPIELTYR